MKMAVHFSYDFRNFIEAKIYIMHQHHFIVYFVQYYTHIDICNIYVLKYVCHINVVHGNFRRKAGKLSNYNFLFIHRFQRVLQIYESVVYVYGPFRDHSYYVHAFFFRCPEPDGTCMLKLEIFHVWKYLNM